MCLPSVSTPSPVLLSLLQLASPALPVGAYSYSEGLETLVHEQHLSTADDLKQWLVQELTSGTIRVEAAILVRLYRSLQQGDRPQWQTWNRWLSAFRETEELRTQSWQMGRSLTRLLVELEPTLAEHLNHNGEPYNEPYNFATAFAIAAHHWNIELELALAGYLFSWASNLVNAGVRLIPLGQTAGQKILLELHPYIQHATQDSLSLMDDELASCGWGLAIASMEHETLYSRLFRS